MLRPTGHVIKNRSSTVVKIPPTTEVYFSQYVHFGIILVISGSCYFQDFISHPLNQFTHSGLGKCRKEGGVQ